MGCLSYLYDKKPFYGPDGDICLRGIVMFTLGSESDNGQCVELMYAVDARLG